jgi:hypothetical protein
MIETGMYEKLAKANGLAISGMQPKITMWKTGMSGVDHHYIVGKRQVSNDSLLEQEVVVSPQILRLHFGTSCRLFHHS